MTATYPSSVRTFTTHVNTTEVIDAGHPNAIQEEVIAIETELGTNPHLTSSFSSSGFSATPSNTAIQTVNARLNNIESGLVADVHPQYMKNSTVTAAGDLVYASGAQAVTKLAIGSQGTILASDGSAPYWSSAAALQGVQGRTGSQGITGTQGALGSQGITGSQGTTGTQGATGTQGTQGSLGAQGLTGSYGAIGTQGIQGSTGVGTQGTQGTQGNYATTYSINTSSSTGLQAVNNDAISVVVMNSASSNTYYINTASSFPIGTTLNFIQAGAGQTTVTGGTGVTVYSTASTASAPKLRVQYSMATAICTASNIWYVSGDIV